MSLILTKNLDSDLAAFSACILNGTSTRAPVSQNTKLLTEFEISNYTNYLGNLKVYGAVGLSTPIRQSDTVIISGATGDMSIYNGAHKVLFYDFESVTLTTLWQGYDYSAGSISTYSWNLQAGSNPVAEIVTGNTVQFTIGIGLGLLYTDSGLGTYTLAYGLNASINNLNDVEITTPISNQILRYNGTGWVNSADTALSWGNHAAAGYLESLTTDGTDNGITIGGTAINPTLKIVSINQAGIGQITVTGSTIGVMLGTTDTTAAAGNHTHTQLHDRSHAITSTDDHTATAHRLFYSNTSGQVVELAFGTNKQLLMSNGASSAPSFVNLSSLDAFTYGLKYFIFRATTPPTLANTNAFNFPSLMLYDVKIYVPDASVSAYKAASNWSTYANYIFPLSYIE